MKSEPWRSLIPPTSCACLGFALMKQVTVLLGPGMLSVVCHISLCFPALFHPAAQRVASAWHFHYWHSFSRIPRCRFPSSFRRRGLKLASAWGLVCTNATTSLPADSLGAKEMLVHMLTWVMSVFCCNKTLESWLTQIRNLTLIISVERI